MRSSARAAFTLLEIVLASAAAAMVLLAIYGVFQGALRLRDSGERRIHAARLRARAETIIRMDLQNALVSGGILASTLAGDSSGTDTNNLTNAGAGSFPGYFKFTTTTGRDSATDLYGDVQQVEYYVIPDPAAPADTGAKAGGILVRSITRDLLDPLNTSGSQTTTGTTQEEILTGVQSFQVSFYDGANWQTSWQFTGLATTASGTTPSPTPSTGLSSSVEGQSGLPDAVRIDIQQAAASPRDSVPLPLEILVPWTTQPFAAATPATSVATAAATATPSPSPTPPPARPPTPPKPAPAPAAGGRSS